MKASAGIIAIVMLLLGCSKSSNNPVPNINDLEIEISGNSALVNIYYPNPDTGLPDTMTLTSLPKKIVYKKLTKDITIIAEKRNVIGSLTITTVTKDKSSSKSTSAPFSSISTFYSNTVGISSLSIHEPEEWPCGTHNGSQLTTGKKGGCYYINSNGNKTYVDRSECNCN
jgi:hypothetical protein